MRHYELKCWFLFKNQVCLFFLSLKASEYASITASENLNISVKPHKIKNFKTL